MTTVSGQIFNFTPKKPYILYQIYSSEEYIYAACNKGLKIFNTSSENLCAYIDNNKGFSSVTGNSNTIYLGTTYSGIKHIKTTCISGSESKPYNLSSCLHDLALPYLSNPHVKYLHCKENYVGVCTISGVDYLRLNTNPSIHSRTLISGAGKCFVTSDKLYYTISGTNTQTNKTEFSLNRVDTCLTDWQQPNASYVTGSGIFNEGIKLTDLYITEQNAENEENTIFCATSSGIYVIDENTKIYAIYYTRN